MQTILQFYFIYYIKYSIFLLKNFSQRKSIFNLNKNYQSNRIKQMSQKFRELVQERERQIEALEILDQLISKMNSQTIVILDNQLEIMGDFQATSNKMNKKDKGFFGFNLDENGVQVSHQKTGIDIFLIQFKVCLNSTVIAFVNVYVDLIKIVIKEKDHLKLSLELNRHRSQFRNLQQEIRSVYGAKKELQACRDKLDKEIDEMSDKLFFMIQNQ
ncbi:hypothetical protein pb186bvf_001715 [Paramecium bursaria]